MVTHSFNTQVAVYAKTFPSSQDIQTDKGQLFTYLNIFLPVKTFLPIVTTSG